MREEFLAFTVGNVYSRITPAHAGRIRYAACGEYGSLGSPPRMREEYRR